MVNRTAKPKNPTTSTVDNPDDSTRPMNRKAAAAFCNAAAESRKKLRRLAIEAFGFTDPNQVHPPGDAVLCALSDSLRDLETAESYCWDLLHGPTEQADGAGK